MHLSSAAAEIFKASSLFKSYTQYKHIISDRKIESCCKERTVEHDGLVLRLRRRKGWEIPPSGTDLRLNSEELMKDGSSLDQVKKTRTSILNQIFCSFLNFTL